MKYLAFLQARLAFLQNVSGDCQERLAEGLVDSLLVKPWSMSFDEVGAMITEITKSDALTAEQKGKVVAFISDVADESEALAKPAPTPLPVAAEPLRKVNGQVCNCFHNYLTAKDISILFDPTIADANKCILLAHKARRLGLDRPNERTFAHVAAIIFACYAEAKKNFKIGAGDRGIAMVRELKAMHASLPSCLHAQKVKLAGRNTQKPPKPTFKN